MRQKLREISKVLHNQLLPLSSFVFSHCEQKRELIRFEVANQISRTFLSKLATVFKYYITGGTHVGFRNVGCYSY